MEEYPQCEWQPYGGRSYAQAGEDYIILNIFNRIGIVQPSYLDLGAHHPFDISNSALLYLRGSRGINVEANPNLMAAFLRYRPDDINLCCGVGPIPGTLDFYMADPVSGRNSFVRKLAAEWGHVQKISVPVFTVTDIVQNYAQGVFPDFLSVDVEGLDYDVLKSIDYNAKSTPKVICVELFSGGKGQFDSTTDIKLLLHDKYFVYFLAGANGIFVRRDYAGKLY